VPETVVDVFEMVDVEQTESSAGMLQPGTPQDRLQTGRETAPAGKAGQSIVVRLIRELVLRVPQRLMMGSIMAWSSG
jgi:hypothetical protein